MDNKGVGIVTLPGRYNYGNRLQNYATAWLYKELGFNPVTLELNDHRILRSVKRSFMGIIGRPYIPHESLMSQARLAAFDRFNASLTIRKVSNKRSLCDFACFSTGSDQVWNETIVGHSLGWYYLNFAKREQRIALAPSIGLDHLSSSQLRHLRRGANLFDELSVREKRGAELIYKATGKRAEVICDPTLVLAPEEWRALSDDRLTPAEPYVFTYLLGGLGKSAARVLDDVTDYGRLTVIPLSDRQKPEEPDAGPAEFISLIDNAAHVVTDSFHAAVFSSILQTPLTIVRREGGARMFSRLETLAQTLGIEHKIYGSPDFDLSRAGDYEGVPVAIEHERRKFMDYLESRLDAQLPGWRGDARA